MGERPGLSPHAVCESEEPTESQDRELLLLPAKSSFQLKPWKLGSCGSWSPRPLEFLLLLTSLRCSFIPRTGQLEARGGRWARGWCPQCFVSATPVNSQKNQNTPGAKNKPKTGKKSGKRTVNAAFAFRDLGGPWLSYGKQEEALARPEELSSAFLVPPRERRKTVGS
jgi:hypothetical protein